MTPPADLAALVSAEEVARLRHENEPLRGEMNLLKFKIELLVDMVTLANLDCDKLEAKGGERAGAARPRCRHTAMILLCV